MKVGDRVAGLFPGTSLAPAIVVVTQENRYLVQRVDDTQHLFVGTAYLTHEHDLEPETRKAFQLYWEQIEQALRGSTMRWFAYMDGDRVSDAHASEQECIDWLNTYRAEHPKAEGIFSWMGEQYLDSGGSLVLQRGDLSFKCNNLDAAGDKHCFLYTRSDGMWRGQMAQFRPVGNEAQFRAFALNFLTEAVEAQPKATAEGV
jgi:hypothetical protein